MKNKIIKLFSIFSLSSVALVYTLLAVFLYWLYFDTSQPIKYLAMEPTNKVLQAGDSFKIEVHYVKNRICDTKFSEIIVKDDNGYKMVYLLADNVIKSNTLPKGKGFYEIGIVLPDDINTGKWFFQKITYHKCNPFRTITVYSPMVDFVVFD